VTRHRIGLQTSVLAVGVLLVCAPAVFAATCSWQKVTGPRIHGGLFGVSARSSSDAWAVGVSIHQTLAEHWNGASWRLVPTPNPGGRGGDWLRAVADITPADVWAVGGFGSNPTVVSSGPLLLHWNGRVWKRRLLPRAVHHAVLTSITGTSPHDVWIVGTNQNGGVSRLLHYDGTSWALVSIRGVNLAAAASTDATDVWAVGIGGMGQDVFERWDGHAWGALMPTLASIGAQSVAATATTDAWASGEGGVDHWNGQAWTAIQKPPLRYLIELVAASGPTDAWVSAFDGFALAAGHWNGAHWSFADIPSRLPSAIEAITNIPAGQTYWQVGFTRHFQPGNSMYETPRIEACS